MISLIPDKYEIEARFVPSIATSAPFFLFMFFYLNGADGFWHSMFGMAVGGLGFSTVLLLVTVHLSRAIGKLIEEHLYDGDLAFPTTLYLLDGSTILSEPYKRRVISKVQDRFGIALSAHMGDTPDNRRLISEAVRQMRRLFFGKNPLLLQRNIQYGFSKNLLGGSLVAILIAAIGAVFSSVSDNDVALSISWILLIVYGLLAGVAYRLMMFTANHYAQTLYDEFLGLE